MTSEISASGTGAAGATACVATPGARNTKQIAFIEAQQMDRRLSLTGGQLDLSGAFDEDEAALMQNYAIDSSKLRARVGPVVDGA